MKEELRILVVEDNPADADFIRELLPETGPVTFLTESVARLSEALTRLTINGIDLVLLDLSLPDSQGLPTFQQLRDAVPDIPVIVLTGTDDQELAVAAVRAGAQDFLVKGQFSGSLLTRAIRYARERQQAETALRESEEKYRTLFNSAGDAILIHDEEMKVLAVNTLACERLDYSHAELMSLTVDQVDSPADALLVPERLARLNAQGQHTFETTHRRKNGSTLPIEVNARRITWQGQPAIMSICRDITERKLAEQTMRNWNQILEHRVAERTAELRQSEARFSQLAEVTFEGIAISAGGILLDCNPQLAQLFGYELDEMIGRPLTEFLARESRKLAARNVRNNGGMTRELVGLRKDGSTFPLEAHARMKTVQGRKMQVAALRDLSAVKQAAARIQAQQTELEHAHRFALVSEVSTGIIHQIGQPLFALASNVAVALANLKSCELQPCNSWEILKDIEAGVACMREIVSDLRALAHPGQLNRVRIDFNDLLEEVLHLLRQEAESRQIQLSVRLGLDLPPVQANAVQLGQVILNLVRNAFDAYADCLTEPRSVDIMTRAINGEGVELSVRDAGSGIAPEAMSRLFAPFFTTKPNGMGIGLRLSQTIVETHGGRIGGSNNADGAGATFQVVLPAHPE